MADVILLRFGKIKSAAHRRALLQQLRDAARAAVPQDQPHYRLGTLKHNQFKVELPGGEGTVDAEGAMFDLDEPDFLTISLLFALYLGRLPGLTEERNVKRLFIETRPGEGLEHLLKDFPRFLRALKKQGKSVPEGGGLSSMAVHKELRLPGGEIFIPLDVTGYSWRANTDHLIQPNIEAWLAIARAFCRKTKRKTGMIVKGKNFVLDGGRRYPLNRLESRTAPDDVIA